ncbi:hypothetical protein MLD38_039880 [Melastoma candidum]|uniref:Uncharacterized protein n=1 Tax=Melastoma candidum TaxID=119954 RepID=A0ACB9L4D0_9MYRT|nr:hypothetical protein MLD38_039880 [Melastoma candidum]
MVNVERFCVVLILTSAMVSVARGGIDGIWHVARATFYRDETGQGTMQGACGYGDLFEQGYGLETTALSTALFNDGLSCGFGTSRTQ